MPPKPQAIYVGFTYAVLAAAMLGCGIAPSSTTGGTRGTIRVGTKHNLPDIQVNVYLMESDKPELIGMGVSQSNGQFELISSDGQKPLWLKPANYAFTLQSIGSVPLVWKEPVNRADQTPLRKQWTANDATLDLDVPAPIARK